MSTVAKTLALLNLLSPLKPKLGLTEFVQLTGNDKATTFRRLTELVKAGFLEQDPVDKTYHLGSGLTRLALVREETFPVQELAMQVLQELNKEVHETVHMTLLQGDNGLNTIAHVDDKIHGNRVWIDPAAILPLHATASGMVVLAFADQALRNKVLNSKLEKITQHTSNTAEQLQKNLETFKQQGYSKVVGTYELDVCGLAAPIYNKQQAVIGAIAIALPVSRLTDEATLVQALQTKAQQLTRKLGG